MCALYTLGSEWVGVGLGGGGMGGGWGVGRDDMVFKPGETQFCPISRSWRGRRIIVELSVVSSVSAKEDIVKISNYWLLVRRRLHKLFI